MKKIISGIQQIGIGVPDVHAGFDLYKQMFGTDIIMFDDNGTAELMLPYTNNQPQYRHAMLALNLKGGGGFEIWQYTTRTPEPAPFDIQVGDLGIFVCKIKSDDVAATYDEMEKQGLELLSKPCESPSGILHFYVKDTYGNVFEVIGGLPFFSKGKRHTGGVAGMSVGVSEMDSSIEFYKDILGYDEVLSDETGTFADLKGLEGGEKAFRRVLLTHSVPRKGSFSHLLGKTHIELFQAMDYSPRKMYEGRQWGDLGYIHVCFDVKGMAAIKEQCSAAGHPFTVDSGDSRFDMGEAAGHFAYVEDPDGTLVELVETFKIPIMKKMGLYLNVEKRNPEKALPDWLLKMLRFV